MTLGVTPTDISTFPVTDPLGFLQLLVSAGKVGHYFAVAVGALIAVIAGAKKLSGTFGSTVPALKVLDTDRGGTILALLMGVLSVVGAALLSGQPFTWPLLVAGLGAGVSAIGGFTGIKRLLFPADSTTTTGVVTGTAPSNPSNL